MAKILIVVDMLNDFVHEKGTLNFEFARNIVPFVKEHIKTYRKSEQVMIIHLCDSHAEDDLEFKRFPVHAVTDTWGAQIIDDLLPEDGGLLTDIVVTKKRYSGFFGTSLDAILNVHKPDEVEVVGVCTSICVMDTVGGLANRDYKVTVPVKGVADFDNDAHKMALDRMENLYGAIIIEP